MLPVIEQFISLDGEGPTAGELAYFVRFEGCNLRCSWCDTAYSWDNSTAVQWKEAQQIYEEIKDRPRYIVADECGGRRDEE